MWQFTQDYGSWVALGMIYLFMARMHMGGGHSMHGASNPQGMEARQRNSAAGTSMVGNPNNPRTKEKRIPRAITPTAWATWATWATWAAALVTPIRAGRSAVLRLGTEAATEMPLRCH